MGMIGAAIRRYHIDAKLGAGGMGTVYRATDTHLNRSVALKILSPGAIANPGRRQRFLQEARAASLLNHPNIVTIFDTGVEEVEGQRLDFIAMELISGRTVESLISGSGLALRDTLEYAIQMADALSAAHAAGIVHRDLKPSNVMVTEQGLVKVLDFGLAKMAESTQPDVDDFGATEPVSFLTEDGIILGTVAYMSPEQAEGKKLDSRSDIFSFGSVLYEMITGRKAFSGDSKVSMLSAVLCKEPPPLDTSLTEFPRDLEVILQRCLRKDPRRRWQSMADLRVALEDVLEVVKNPPAVVVTPLARAAASSRRRWLMPAIAGLVLGAIPAAYLGHRLVHHDPPVYQRLTYRRGDVLSARFAPGGTVIYGAQWDGDPVSLFSVQPGSRESRALGLSKSILLSVNSAGEMAILKGVTENGEPGTLARVPYSGGTPRDILEGVVAADWGPDGETMAVARIVDGRNRIEYPIGRVLVEDQSRPSPSIRISPRGDMVAYFDYDSEVGDYSVVVAGLSQPHKILSRGWRGTSGLAWSPDGKEIWFAGVHGGVDPALNAVDLSGKQRVLAYTAGYAMLLDVDRQGHALLTNTYSRIGIRCVTPGSATEVDLAWLDASWLHDLSSDARSILFLELSYGEGRNSAIYLRRTDGSPAVKLGFGNRPVLSPDGKSVLCVRRNGASSELVILSTGAGEAKTLPGPGFHYESSKWTPDESAEWTPDGRRVLFSASEGGHGVRSYTQDVMGGKPVAITEEGVRATRMSADGSVILITGDKLSIHSTQGKAERALKGYQSGDVLLRWSADGQSILIRHDDADTGNIGLYRLNPVTGVRTELREIKPPEPGAHFLGHLAIAGDGRYYATSYQRDIGILYQVAGIE